MSMEKRTFRIIAGKERIGVNTIEEFTILDAIGTLRENISKGICIERERVETRNGKICKCIWIEKLTAGRISILDAENNYCYTVDLNDFDELVVCFIDMDIADLQNPMNPFIPYGRIWRP